MWKRIMLGAAVALFGVAATLEFSAPTPGDGRAPIVASTPVLSLSTAAAVTPRGVARRTTRRTARRVVRRTSIAGCAHRPPYYYCAGVYYRPVVENGVTVYVEINP